MPRGGWRRAPAAPDGCRDAGSRPPRRETACLPTALRAPDTDPPPPPPPSAPPLPGDRAAPAACVPACPQPPSVAPAPAGRAQQARPVRDLRRRGRRRRPRRPRRRRRRLRERTPNGIRRPAKALDRVGRSGEGGESESRRLAIAKQIPRREIAVDQVQVSERVCVAALGESRVRASVSLFLSVCMPTFLSICLGLCPSACLPPCLPESPFLRPCSPERGRAARWTARAVRDCCYGGLSTAPPATSRGRGGRG